MFIGAFAWFVFGENFDRRIALGMVAIVRGGALLISAGSLLIGKTYAASTGG